MAQTKITTNSLADASVTSAKLANSISIGTLTVTGNLAVDTNTLFVDSANNRVGVGTVTPAVSLDTIGKIGFGDASNRFSLGSNSAFPSRMAMGFQNGSELLFYTGTTAGINSIKWNCTSGYNYEFGPGGRLVILGDGTDMWWQGTGGDFTKYMKSEFTSGVGLIYSTDGHISLQHTGSYNVGIGTTSPTAKLDVNGTLNVAGNTTLVGTTVATGKITANGQGALSALADNDVLTRGGMESLLMDPSVLYLRDEFISVTDGANPFGEMGWVYQSLLGTGNVRPSNISGLGVAGLHTGAVFRGSTCAYWDTSNIIGGGGFAFSSLGVENTSTVIKARIRFHSLSGSYKFGFQIPPLAATFKNQRFFGLRYSLPASSWTATTAVTLNEYRRPVVANGRRYFASIGGTTGGSEPIWPTTVDATVTDGTVTWKENGLDGNPNILLQDIAATNDEMLSTIVDTGIAATADTWYNIEIRFVSGSTWGFYINGAFVGNLTMNVSTRGSGICPHFAVETSIAAANQISIDYFLMFSKGITRYHA